jgi:cytochrome d ubiquinol oxidase subunit I
MDPLFLSRAQFAANITSHLLFPSITIALGWLLSYRLFGGRATELRHG